jgi:O-antigen/teichoic acid export membrane protein
MKTVKTFVKNSAANYGQKVIRASIGLLTIGLIARYLRPGVFGLYAYILAFVTIAEVTTGMGVPIILCREVAKDKTKASSLIACAVSEIFKFLGRFFWSVYQAFERMGFGTLQTFIIEGLYLILVVVVTRMDLGLFGLFTGMLLAHLAGAIFGYVTVTKFFARLDFENVKGLFKFLLKQSYPLAIRGLFQKLNYRASTLLLAALKTNFEVGIFNGPHKIILNLLFISEGSTQAIFPILSRFTASSRASLDKAYQTSLKFALLMGLPIAIFLSKFSKALVVLILGHKYVESAPVLSIIAWALVPLFVVGFMQKVLVAGNKQGLTTWATAAGLGVNLILNLILIPGMGGEGAAIATIASQVVPLCLNVYFVGKYLELHVRLPVIAKPLLAGVATFGALAVLPHMNIFVGAVVEVLVYATVVLGIRTFSEEEISLAKELLRGAVSARAVGG